MKSISLLKKFLAVLLFVILSVCCIWTLAACGDTGDDTGGDNGGNAGNTDDTGGSDDGGSTDEEITFSIYGRFEYNDDGSTVDSYGATWVCYIDTGNKFHFYGTLDHDDGTSSYVEFEGQVVATNGYTLQCAQVMFFSYIYHGVEYDPSESGASQVTSDYKNNWMDNYGTSNFYMYLVRTTNDTSETGYAGTFYVEDGWDLSEGVWDLDPTAT